MTKKTPRLEYEEAQKRIRRYGEENTISERDADLILEYGEAFDPENITTPRPDGASHKELSTLRTYLNDLGRIAKQTELATATADDINEVMQSFLNGTADGVKDAGLAKSTTRTYQMIAKSFYGYHDDLECDPSGITGLQEQSSPIDPDDMLKREEIHELRDVATHPRDRAIVDLFLYTGQRATAIRTMQLKHLDLQQGIYKLNATADGLKGADENAKRRPLLLAESSVRNWVQSHPEKDNSEAYLITAKPRYSDPDPSEPVSHDVFTYLSEQLKEGVSYDKPVNPHALRHNFVTIAKRDYDMDNGVIKHLIGHSPSSRVMETTYAHLSDDDYIEAARRAMGNGEYEEDESPLTPPICSNCGENVSHDAKACEGCGVRFTPDSAHLKQGAESRIVEVQNEQEGEIVQEILKNVRENPEDYLG